MRTDFLYSIDTVLEVLLPLFLWSFPIFLPPFTFLQQYLHRYDFDTIYIHRLNWPLIIIFKKWKLKKKPTRPYFYWSINMSLKQQSYPKVTISLLYFFVLSTNCHVSEKPWWLWKWNISLSLMVSSYTRVFAKNRISFFLMAK